METILFLLICTVELDTTYEDLFDINVYKTDQTYNTPPDLFRHFARFCLHFRHDLHNKMKAQRVICACSFETYHTKKV